MKHAFPEHRYLRVAVCAHSSLNVAPFTGVIYVACEDPASLLLPAYSGIMATDENTPPPGTTGGTTAP